MAYNQQPQVDENLLQRYLDALRQSAPAGANAMLGQAPAAFQNAAQQAGGYGNAALAGLNGLLPGSGAAPNAYGGVIDKAGGIGNMAMMGANGVLPGSGTAMKNLGNAVGDIGLGRMAIGGLGALSPGLPQAIEWLSGKFGGGESADYDRSAPATAGGQLVPGPDAIQALIEGGATTSGPPGFVPGGGPPGPSGGPGTGAGGGGGVTQPPPGSGITVPPSSGGGTTPPATGGGGSSTPPGGVGGGSSLVPDGGVTGGGSSAVPGGPRDIGVDDIIPPMTGGASSAVQENPPGYPDGTKTYPSGAVTYTIQPGDSLSLIGAMFGVTYDELIEGNEDLLSKGKASVIHPGDTILITPPPGRGTDTRSGVRDKGFTTAEGAADYSKARRGGFKGADAEKYAKQRGV